MSARPGQLVTARTVAIFRYACPYCASELTEQDDALFCTREGRRFSHEAGIWRLLRRERESGTWLRMRGAADPGERHAGGGSAPMKEDCVAPPFRATPGRPRALWRRTAAFRALERVLDQEFRDRPVRALDLGAGDCWLTRQLTAKGYAACALDVRTDAIDGLGTGHVDGEAQGSRFERVQADLECLPFVGRQFELVIANGSLHHSENVDLALDEARRVLTPDGLFVVIGSPFLTHTSDGAQSLAEPERAQPQVAPLPPAPRVGPFTWDELGRRLRRHGLEAEVRHPFVGLRGWMGAQVARLRGGPEPASYPLLICRPAAE